MKTVLKISTSVAIVFFLLGTNFSDRIKIPEISKNINEFSIAFLKQNAKASGAPANAIMSPQSIYFCLAMSYIASGGDTRKELAKTCRFPDDNKLLEWNIQVLRRHLLNDKNIDVRIANSAWLDKNRANFRKDYIEEVKKNFGASISDINFSKKEKACDIVNSWAAENTNGRIRNIVSPQDFGSNDLPLFRNGAALLLANAVYFKADWGSRFDKSDTEEKTFHLSKTSTTPTMMMHQNSLLRYSEDDKFKFLELPYIGNTYSMYVILPKEITPMEKLMDGINANMISNMEFNAHRAQVDTIFPKFEMKNRLDVKDSLEAMGVKTPFEWNSADFDKMINKTPDALRIYIKKIMQDAWIETNEKGTEAAAITTSSHFSVGCAADIDGPFYKRVIFHADHPFLFLIVHNQSKSILFGGWISNPDKLKE